MEGSPTAAELDTPVVAAAEEAYQDYLAAEALDNEDDDEERSNPPISVDTSDAAPPELEDVITIPVSPNTQQEAVQEAQQTPQQEAQQTPEKSEPKLKVITDSLIQQNLEPDKSIQVNDEDNSAKRKTIKFEAQ